VKRFKATRLPKNFSIAGQFFLLVLIGIGLSMILSCNDNGNEQAEGPDITPPENKVEGVDYFLPHIDLSHWKVTLPIGNPTEVGPPAILDYATNETLKPFMYNDSTDGSLVFYTYPGSSTANSSYSRTELREQMVPGSNETNWTFVEGGRMKGTLAMGEISMDADNKYHRTIIMQIHGRLTDAQRDLIDEDDNNAPPVLKIYWAFGRVRVIRKVLKDVNVSDVDILKVDSWGDEGEWFDEVVNFDQFDLEVIASEGKLEVILNDKEHMVFEDIHTQKWSVFENYFKAGNYLATKDSGAFARVKYYALEVKH
jgi:hypothetical protein